MVDAQELAGVGQGESAAGPRLPAACGAGRRRGSGCRPAPRRRRPGSPAITARLARKTGGSSQVGSASRARTAAAMQAASSRLARMRASASQDWPRPHWSATRSKRPRASASQLRALVEIAAAGQQLGRQQLADAAGLDVELAREGERIADVVPRRLGAAALQRGPGRPVVGQPADRDVGLCLAGQLGQGAGAAHGVTGHDAADSLEQPLHGRLQGRGGEPLAARHRGPGRSPRPRWPAGRRRRG